MKVAKLVYVTLLTRVIVDSEADDSDTMEIAVPKLCENLENSPMENIDKIVLDIECPYVIGEQQGLEIGDDVLMPDPKPDGSDSWQFGEFSATIRKFYEHEGVEYASVEDGDGDFFDIELERLEGAKVEDEKFFYWDIHVACGRNSYSIGLRTLNELNDEQLINYAIRLNKFQEKGDSDMVDDLSQITEEQYNEWFPEK